MENEKACENEKMPPPSVKFAGYTVALDVLAVIIALILIFEGNNIAQYFKTTANLPQLGYFLLFLGLVLFVLGRLKTD